MAPSASASLDATLSVPVGDCIPDTSELEDADGVGCTSVVGVDATSADLGTGLIFAGTIPGGRLDAGRVIAFALTPYFCSAMEYGLTRKQ